MHIIVVIFQIIVAVVLLAVWLFRPNQPTAYRGGDAKTMKEEFAVYGLPVWMMYLVGTLKVGAALALLIGVGIHMLVFPAALLIVLLMIGAIIMHLKVHDPSKKSIPAVVLLMLSACISFLSRP
jgi:uncharacterized membrane protein